MKVLFARNNINLALVAADCTSKCQQLNTCINKPNKGILRNFWKTISLTVLLISTKTEEQRENFKLPSPSKHKILLTVLLNYLKNYLDIIKN